MNWPLVRIGGITKQLRGVTYSKEQVRNVPGPGFIPILRANNITDSGLTLQDLIYVPVSCVSNLQRVREGDIVIAASSGSLSVVGKAAQATQSSDISFGAFCKLIRPSDAVHAGYLGHFFKTKKYRRTISSLAAGANINNLKSEHIDNLELSLPPMGEQRRIAAILDQAEALRAKRRQALAKLDTLTQSLFLEMFGSPLSPNTSLPLRSLSDVADFFAGNSLPAGVEYEGQEGGAFLMKVSDMNTNGNESLIRTCALWRINPAKSAISCPPDSVVIPKRGGAIGTNKKRLSTRTTYLDPNLMAIHAHEGTLTHAYLFHWFKLFDLNTLVSGSSVPQLNKRDLAPLRIAVPPLDYQQRFGLLLQNLNRTVGHIRKSDQMLDAVSCALQHRAFQGEL